MYNSIIARREAVHRRPTSTSAQCSRGQPRHPRACEGIARVSASSPRDAPGWDKQRHAHAHNIRTTRCDTCCEPATHPRRTRRRTEYRPTTDANQPTKQHTHPTPAPSMNAVRSPTARYSARVAGRQTSDENRGRFRRVTANCTVPPRPPLNLFWLYVCMYVCMYVCSGWHSFVSFSSFGKFLSVSFTAVGARPICLSRRTVIRGSCVDELSAERRYCHFTHGWFRCDIRRHDICLQLGKATAPAVLHISVA